MSKAIYICSKNKINKQTTASKLEKICNYLTPDNITSNNNHTVVVDEQIAYAITLNNTLSKRFESSLLLGMLFEESDNSNWNEAGAPYPNGNYALFRNSDENFEIVSDAIGSRTIWYYHDNETFIASTSQRAIIIYLENFLFDEKVIPWMLSSGSLGPEHSWDQRLRRLKPDSSILLNKKEWTISESNKPFIFQPSDVEKDTLKRDLESAIEKTVSYLNKLDLKHWIFPLSGGYDSRALLYYLKKQVGLPADFKTVTWGIDGSEDEKLNDASISQRLANREKTAHRYFTIDKPQESVEVIVDRFLKCGEGRVDQINVYIDGMRIWKQFYEENITGILRGDIVFGCPETNDEKSARFYNALALCNEYNSLEALNKRFNLPEQKIPRFLNKRESETNQQYMYRLHSQNKVPTVLSALSDVKYSFIEQLTPFLNKSIAEQVRKQPDSIRMNKALFKDIVQSAYPKVPFAIRSATPSLSSVIESEDFLAYTKKTLKSKTSKKLYDDEMLKLVLEKMENEQANESYLITKLKRMSFKYLPELLLKTAFSLKKGAVRSTHKPSINYNLVAFRLSLIVNMVDLLNKDAEYLKSS